MFDLDSQMNDLGSQMDFLMALVLGELLEEWLAPLMNGLGFEMGFQWE